MTRQPQWLSGVNALPGQGRRPSGCSTT
jgi:hypothetical protein